MQKVDTRFKITDYKNIEKTNVLAALNKLADEGDLELRVALVLPVYSLEDVDRKIELWKKGA